MTEAIDIPRARCLPWHDSAVSQLKTAWSAQRMPHALLLTGADGVGKRELAAWLACAALCENSTTELQCCDSCASCKLIRAGSHPDVLWVMPLEDKQQISIEQIRAASERLSKTSYRQGYKIAIVTPAHLMTLNAANSLLKTLEEPAAGSLLILLTSQPSGLPATVRSRCQRVVVSRPTKEQALGWLQAEVPSATGSALLEFFAGAPLRAAEYSDKFATLDQEMQRSLGELLAGDTDVTQVASAWGKEGLPERLTWLDLWLSAAARGAISGNADLITFPARSAHLPSLPHTLNITGLYSMVDRVRALKAQLARTALQRELAIESWLVSLLQLLAPTRAQNRQAP